MFTLIRQFWQLGFCNPLTWWALWRAYRAEGGNSALPLAWRARLSPDTLAFDDGQRTWTYAQLWADSLAWAAANPRPRGQRLGLCGRNSGAWLVAFWALVRQGQSVYLLNPDLSAVQLAALAAHHQLEALVCEAAYSHKMPDNLPLGLLELGLQTAPTALLAPVSGGKIVLLSAGTTGLPKASPRRPAMLQFLAPFFYLLRYLHLERYQKLYIPLPFFHGHGLSSLILATALGRTVYTRPRFEVQEALALIEKEGIEVISLVPLMLQRLWQKGPRILAQVSCLISGSAPLSPALAQACLALNPRSLFHLYGSSEAGFSVMASPQDLARHPDTLGCPIWGVRLRLLNGQGQVCQPLEPGFLELCNAWSIGEGQQWIRSGDLAYRNAAGLLFFAGREDDMIVSGGENVYPNDLERVLLQDTAIADASVIGVPDAEFGQRLRAFVKLRQAPLDEPALRQRLSQKLARFQMPREIIVLPELPYTSLGKPDKKALRNWEA